MVVYPCSWLLAYHQLTQAVPLGLFSKDTQETLLAMVDLGLLKLAANGDIMRAASVPSAFIEQLESIV